MPRPLLPFQRRDRDERVEYAALREVDVPLTGRRSSPRSPCFRFVQCCPETAPHSEIPIMPPTVTDDVSTIVEDVVRQKRVSFGNTSPVANQRLSTSTSQRLSTSTGATTPLRRQSTVPLLDWTMLKEEEQARNSSYFSWCASLVIIPDYRSWWLNLWDLTVVLGLFIVACYEPFALALLDRELEPWYCIIVNRVLDFIFTVDIILHFFIAYKKDGVRLGENMWETRPAKLAQRYCGMPFSAGGSGGWFWLDLLAVTPGWLSVGWTLFHPRNTLAQSFIESGKNINGMLMMRILRLFLLTRFRRFSKLIELWQAHWGFAFYVVDCAKFTIITSLTCHWMACIWCMVEGRVTKGLISSTTEEPTWLSALIDSKGDSCYPSAGENPLCVHQLAYYWATTTLTSVGYGDIVPQNHMEYTASIICMTIIAYVWAYIVGSIVSILSNIDPHTVSFKQNMDWLNELMVKHGLPQDLRIKLRTYMNASREFSRLAEQRHLMQRVVSRGLQLEVAARGPEVQSILRDVFWVKDLEETAILEIVRALQPNSYGPYEIIHLPETMIVMHKGLAGVRGRILSRGHVWGAADILLDTPQLKETASPRTITYVEIFMLTKNDLIEVCKGFPLADQRLRRAQIRTAVRRAFVRAAEKKKRMKVYRSSRAPQMARAGSGALGSFVYPGMHRIDVGRREENNDTVELPEIKHLLLQLQQSQERSARETSSRIEALENRVEDVWQYVQDLHPINEPTTAMSGTHSASVAVSAARAAGSVGRSLVNAASRMVPKKTHTLSLDMH